MKALALVACLGLAGCVAHTRPPPVYPDGTSCKTMCDRFTEFGCAAGKPSPRLHVTCEERCEDQRVTGAVAPPIACVSQAASADDVRACGERCAP